MGGENFVGTLENKGVRISPFHEFEDDISAELKTELGELETAIAGGTVKVADYLK
jgi:basic membrane protein A